MANGYARSRGHGQEMSGLPEVRNKPHAPASELKTIPLAWPFAQWGLNMVGPLRKSSPGGHTHLLVAVDKFTKWIEAILITSSTASTAFNFIRSIIFRFGVPNSIITDNGTNFTAEEFKDFCVDQGIKLNYASVAYPQSNGQVEKANGLVCKVKEQARLLLRFGVNDTTHTELIVYSSLSRFVHV